MTKKAILEGLSNSGVVLLATHGKVDEDYPYGCLLLQGPTKSCDVTCTSASISAQTYVLMVEEPPSMPAETPKGKGIIQHELEHATDKGGHDRLSLFEGTDVETKCMKAEDTDQVLTAAEIATLENGISAELVVLSACESGLGQATASEGLLGLGRALLQAGAATAILTLWKVDDLMTSRFGAAPVTRRPVIAIQIERWIVSCGAGLHYYLKYPPYWVLTDTETTALCIVQVCSTSSSLQPQKAGM
jgi:hypothetical protein